VAEVAAIESWFKEGKDPVQPTYKKDATAVYKRIDDTIVKTLALIGSWVSKLKYPDGDMSNEDGEMGILTVTLTVDDYDTL
jgi:hypothetical protein